MIQRYLKCNVILHLMNEMDHLRCQNVTVMQHPRELCKRVKELMLDTTGKRTEKQHHALPPAYL